MANSFFKPCSRLAGGEISSDLFRDWRWDGSFKFCLILTHFNRFSPFLGYIWRNNTLSSLKNFSLNSIYCFLCVFDVSTWQWGISWNRTKKGFNIKENLFVYHGHQHDDLKIMIFSSRTSFTFCFFVPFPLVFSYHVGTLEPWQRL